MPQWLLKKRFDKSAALNGEDLFPKTGKVEEMAAMRKMAILDANERIYKIIKDIVG